MKMGRSLVFLPALPIAVPAIAAADVFVVKIQATQLRKNPQFFAPAVVALKAGDKLEKVSEADLSGKITVAPWSPVEMILGQHLLHMVDHLKSHKSQLYYYLKLQGKPVNTGNLWGM